MKIGLPQTNYTPVLYGKAASAFSKEKGHWLLANVDQGIGWPIKKVLIIYRGRQILLLPATKAFHAAAAVITLDRTLKEGKTVLMQFMSALAWHSPGKLEIIRFTDSTSIASLDKHLRLPLQKRPGVGHLHFRPTELPDPKDPKAQLALGLFREGLSINHLGYSFLSFYKIINLRYPNTDKQQRFIRRSLPLIQHQHHLKDRFKQLNAQHKDPTIYIYEACRCAVAHASMKRTTYNPESLEDEIRFYEIYPIIQALAKILIEQEFKVKTTFSLLGEHLYELAGFHHLLGEKVSKALKAGETLPLAALQLDTKMSLRLWNKRKLKAFENLQVAVLAIRRGVVTLSLTRDQITKFQIILDFPREKLIFDPTQSINFKDDGSKNAAMQLSNAYQFYSEFMGNAVLEVWETKTNRILGRLLEYLPTVRPGQPLPHVVQKNCIAQMLVWREKARKRVTLKAK